MGIEPAACSAIVNHSATAQPSMIVKISIRHSKMVCRKNRDKHFRKPPENNTKNTF